MKFCLEKWFYKILFWIKQGQWNLHEIYQWEIVHDQQLMSTCLTVYNYYYCIINPLTSEMSIILNATSNLFLILV